MYNTHTISTLVSHLVPADLILTPLESCKTVSSPYLLTQNWYIVTSLNCVFSVFGLQADMYVHTHTSNYICISTLQLLHRKIAWDNSIQASSRGCL